MAAVIFCLGFKAFRGHAAVSYPLALTFQQPHKHSSSDIAQIKKFPVVATETAALKRGTGGRSSFNGVVATVFGASGFLGRYVCNQLGKLGTQLIIPYRGDAYDVLRLKLCGDLGQVLFQPYDLKDEDSLYESMKYSNLVINLIGRNFETSNFPFEEVHVKGARNIARVARECGVQRLIHISALNACEKPKPIVLKKGSGFLASKWRGEMAVREEFPDAIIFRPSDIYGHEDTFIRYYVSHWRHTIRFLSLWKRGKYTIKQPVFVSDVTKGIIRAVTDPDVVGKTYQAVGPHRYQLGELMDWFHRVMKKSTEEYAYLRIDMRFDPTFWLRLYFSELVFRKNKLLSWERLERECVTDELIPGMPTLEDLGVKLTLMEDRIAYELKLFRAHAYHDGDLEDYYMKPIEPAPLATS